MLATPLKMWGMFCSSVLNFAGQFVVHGYFMGDTTLIWNMSFRKLYIYNMA